MQRWGDRPKEVGPFLRNSCSAVQPPQRNVTAWCLHANDCVTGAAFESIGLLSIALPSACVLSHDNQFDQWTTFTLSHTHRSL